MKTNERHYWARMKISGEWLGWHLMDGKFTNDLDAKKAFMVNTRFTKDEVEVTDQKPAKYFGRRENFIPYDV